MAASSAVRTTRLGRDRQLPAGLAAGKHRRSADVGAATRAQPVLRESPRTPAAEEARFPMATSYQQLGLDVLRNDAQRVLEKNFPKSRFLSGEAAAQSTKSWWQFW